MNDVLTATLEEVRIKSTAMGSVFCSRRGAPSRFFRTVFERAVQGAVIPDFTLHDLRHTFTSQLAMSGVDLPTVKELMGHKDITITLRYIQLSSGRKHSAVRTLQQFGMWSRQFSRQDETFAAGRLHKLLKNDFAPLAQLDRASDF